MAETTKRVAVFPGTFDPVTNGHVDIIRRGARLFDELVVAVGENPEKTSLLAQGQRVAVLEEVVAELGNVRVEPYGGLTVDVARRLGAVAILRGIRSSSDLHFELQAAFTNRQVAGVETVFIMTRAEFGFISSSLIKQIATGGGDISALVPPQAVPHVQRAVKGGK